MIRIAMLILTTLVTSAAAAGDLPTVEEVLDRFVTAAGGVAAFEAVSARHYRGAILQDLDWDDPQHRETSFVAEADAAGRVRYAEDTDWTGLPETGAAGLSLKLRWILHPRFALVVREFFPGLRVDRREMRAGRSVVVLVPENLRPEFHSLYFDEQTGLLNHVGYHNDLGDWREADGVLYPYCWVFGRKGGHTTYVFETVAPGPAPAGG